MIDVGNRLHNINFAAAIAAFAMSPPQSSFFRLVSFAVTILTGAFLVFQVQPLVSKAILPWFGGSPAVWTTCMLFFQVVLFGGYLYAHLLSRWLPLKWQSAVHLLIVVIALCSLPILPDAAWKPTGGESPAPRILLLLLVNVGLPYFVLSATGPLMQIWFLHVSGGQSPYRFFALSNLGSLAALLTYPFVFEPVLSVPAQATAWAAAFGVYAIACGLCALQLWSAAPVGGKRAEEAATDDVVVHVAPVTWQHWVLWLCLPALASVMLLAVTNHVCQNIPVTPFLWVVPLSLYLITFIICFDSPRWYVRPFFVVGAMLLSVVLSQRTKPWFITTNLLEVWVAFAALFFVCMLCHGELVRLKPDARRLTSFYLMIAAGGAVGGCLVAIVCPLIFNSFFELNLSVLAGYVLAVVVLARMNQGRTLASRTAIAIAIPSFLGLVLVANAELDFASEGVLRSSRNFYGTLTVKQGQDFKDPFRAMVHGQVVHGLQYLTDQRRREATTYYYSQSGVGLVLNCFAPEQPLRVGVVGLGAGTVAAYGRKGDKYRFYEINPNVIRTAQSDFTFLAESPAQIDIVLGDARLSLEREAPQNFDVLILDAFSGDSVPTHLLTAEAMDVYMRHLSADGILAVHISNLHLNLAPVVLGLTRSRHLDIELIASPAKRTGQYPAQWILLTRNPTALSKCFANGTATKIQRLQGEGLLWTDQYNNLLQILK